MPHSVTLKSAVVAADAAAVTGRGLFYGAIISGAVGDVVFYDNTAASGNAFLHARGMGAYFLPAPIPFNRGVYVDVTANIVTVLYTGAP